MRNTVTILGAVILGMALCASLVAAGFGDLNNDGVVNVQDLLFVVQNIHAGTIGNADVNGDGVVNIFDLVDVAHDFGKTYTSTGSPLYTTSFENYSVGQTVTGRGYNGWLWGNAGAGGGNSITVTNAVAHTGTQSLRFRYNGGANAEQRFSHPAETHYWVQFYIYYPDGKNGLGASFWQPTAAQHGGSNTNNKFWTVWPENYNEGVPGGKPSVMFQTWSSPSVPGGTRIDSARTDPSSNHMDYGPPNLPTQLNANPFINVTNDKDLGKWTQVRIEIKVADMWQNNGIVRLWKNGKLLFQSTTDPLYDAFNSSHNYLRLGYLLGWANDQYANNTNIYVDDFSFYTQDPGWLDTTPPVISNGTPTGTLNAGTTNTTLTVTTNESATCKYSTAAGTAYSSMTNTFSSTGGTSHSTTVSGLNDGQSYTYYIRCEDTSGNADASDYPVSFVIASASAATPLYSDGFESDAVGSYVSGTGNQHFMWLGSVVTVRVSSLLAHSGTKSLRLEYNNYNPNLSSQASDEQRFNFTPSKEVWFEYYIYFPSGNEGLGLNKYYQRVPSSSGNDKFFTIWADNYQGMPRAVFQTWPTGSNGDNFMNIGRTEGNNTAQGYYDTVLYPDTSSSYQTGTYGNHAGFVGADVTRGQWAQIRIHIKVADVNQSNGEEEMWINGQPVIQILNDPYYDPSGQTNYQSHGYLMGWANSGFNVNTSVFIDDFKMYTSNPGW